MSGHFTTLCMKGLRLSLLNENLEKVLEFHQRFAHMYLQMDQTFKQSLEQSVGYMASKKSIRGNLPGIFLS